MRLVVGADHAGFALKGPVVKKLRQWGHEVIEVGAVDETPIDFPDVAVELCALVVNGDVERGILVCGTGIGASIAANKCRGIRAALAHDPYSAHQCVEHDDANVLCLGAQVVGPDVAFELLGIYLGARFSSAEEFHRRVAKLDAMGSGQPPLS